jgi:L-lysine exporter family protein LysE/ArgO
MHLAVFIPSYLNGLALSLSLIAAIGAQNAFVLRQGLRREHVGLMVLFCAGVDALLMVGGVYGLAALIACSEHGLTTGPGVSLTRRQALWQLAGFTFLNPHVYLDTVLLVGSVGAQQAGLAKTSFVAGASSASLLWFSALGYGARWLAPWFARPRSWAVLDGLIGLMMLVMAALLVRHALA